MIKTIDIVQFYISHTCNIACPGCFSFNNFAISGHDLFADYEKDAEAWSNVILPKDMSIIGGEPMTNPDLHNWAMGVRKYFPKCRDFKICTNGLLIDRWRQHIPEWWDNHIILEVSAHTEAHFEKAQKDIESIVGNKDIVKCTVDNVHQHAAIPAYYTEDYCVFYVYNGKVVSLISKQYNFEKWGIKNIKDNTIKFHNSDPVLAHRNCPINDCHYIYKGKLYKCGTIVGAQDLIEKYNVDKKSAKLWKRYKPLEHSQPDIEEQVQMISTTPVSQCRLCPTNPKMHKIKDSDIKKVKLGYRLDN